MGTTQLEPKGNRKSRRKAIAVSLALFGVIVAAGFAGPQPEVCEQIASGKSPEGAERVCQAPLGFPLPA